MFRKLTENGLETIETPDANRCKCDINVPLYQHKFVALSRWSENVSNNFLK